MGGWENTLLLPQDCIVLFSQLVVQEVESDEAGYDKGLKVSYWFSYDRDRFVLKYGKGYIMEETTIMSYVGVQRPFLVFTHVSRV